MKTVLILMSTFNGEKYLSEQLDSILSQKKILVDILIRDDGSNDSTLNILEEYSMRFNNVSYYSDNNLGVVGSFIDLIQKAEKKYDYYAFSDQDDVWLEEKLFTAVNELSKLDENKPNLYCGNVTLVDKNLNKYNDKFINHVKNPSFNNALIENIATGCTIVFNNKLCTMTGDVTTANIIMHDWWCYLVASYFGTVVYDRNSYIYYRQHDNNVIGSEVSFLRQMKRRVLNFKKNRGKISTQIHEFYNYVSKNNLNIDTKSQNNIEILEKLYKMKCSYILRLRFIFGNDVYRQRKIDNLIFKLIFLTGTI